MNFIDPTSLETEYSCFIWMLNFILKLLTKTAKNATKNRYNDVISISQEQFVV
jgi:hypothetical protein